MYRSSFIFTFIFVISFALIGCNNNSTLEMDDQRVQFTKLNANESLDQQQSNQAKQSIIDFDEITSVHAVNSEKNLVIAFEVDHLERLKLKKIKKKVEKKVNKKIEGLKVVVSTDKKIILELEELEQKIQTNDITEKELNKKIKEIIKLSEEQT